MQGRNFKFKIRHTMNAEPNGDVEASTMTRGEREREKEMKIQRLKEDKLQIS